MTWFPFFLVYLVIHLRNDWEIWSNEKNYTIGVGGKRLLWQFALPFSPTTQSGVWGYLIRSDGSFVKVRSELGRSATIVFIQFVRGSSFRFMSSSPGLSGHRSPWITTKETDPSFVRPPGRWRLELSQTSLSFVPLRFFFSPEIEVSWYEVFIWGPFSVRYMN